MLRQYQKIKTQYPHCILFFRLGDFYEMFYDDAKKASGILDVVLTARGTGKSGKTPMCGIPYHAAEGYIAKLIKAGLKVAICEQTEDPALAKGLVKRDVIRVITSGTFIDDHTYEPRYLLSLNFNNKSIGVAFTDTTSGTIHVNEYPDENKIVDVISKLSLFECVFPENEETRVKKIFNHPILRNKKITLSPHQEWNFNPDIARKSLCEHFATHTLRGFGIEAMTSATSSAGALLEYIKQMNRQPMRHIDKISLYTDSEHVFISPAACYGLELSSLICALDHTLTPLGKRAFYYWIHHPLKNTEAIIQRQEAITMLKDNPGIAENLRGLLRNTPDIEKSILRISSGYVKSRDLLALRSTLLRVPDIQNELKNLTEQNTLFSLKDIPELRTLLEEAINPEIPLSHPEGKIIRTGYNEELDSLRDIQENGRQWLKNLQTDYIKRTKINSLKIGFNKVFGYYIEVSKTNLRLVPEDFIRKQTLVNAERYITQELKEFEEKMLSAQDNVLKIETAILNTIYTRILDHSKELHKCAANLSTIDVLYSLNILACQNGYIAPEITSDTELIIKEGRHPVVENTSPDPFVPNDTLLDCEANHLLIITGPNMAGKSTYIRQTAILVILAQIGSYIPARSARVGIVDKIFTRIGAHDEISKGQSTFMVEMSEAAEILNNLSPKSLVILDELGRGTSTYDGLSLAWSIAEYLQKWKVRTLFATHYHELTVLAEENSGIKNYNVAVKEWNEEIIFLHKIIPGGTDDSYGIYVAQLAGIPDEVVKRSKQILSRLETQGNIQEKIHTNITDEKQLSFFSAPQDEIMEKVKGDISSLDIDNMTPVQALKSINEWKELLDTNVKSAHTCPGCNQ